MKPLFWEEEHIMQLLNNTNVVWTIHIKTAETVHQHSNYKQGFFFSTPHIFLVQAIQFKVAVFPC